VTAPVHLGTVIGASLRTQIRLLLRRPGSLAILVVTPLYVVVLFGVATRHDPSRELLTTLSLTAFVMAAWGHGMFTASQVIDDERFNGTLEIHMSAPSGYVMSLIVRTFTVALVAAPALGEVMVITWLTHGTSIAVRRPAQFGIAVLICIAGCAASSLLLGSLLLLVKGARTLQNAVTYPFYLLGGLVVPHSALPPGIRQISDFFFLTWAVKGMREACTASAGGWTHLAFATVLTVIQTAVGTLLLHRVVQRLRRGEVSLYG
jgi:ABC-2 type transport system permease protein